MHCSDVETKFDRYLDDDLRTTERLCLAVHLSQCYTCRETLDEYRFLDGAVSTGLRQPNPVSHFSGVMARVRLSERTKRTRFQSRFHPWYTGKRFILASGLVLTTALSSPWLLDAVAPGGNVAPGDGVGSGDQGVGAPRMLRTLTDRAQGIVFEDDTLLGGHESPGSRKNATTETTDAPL